MMLGVIRETYLDLWIPCIPPKATGQSGLHSFTNPKTGKPTISRPDKSTQNNLISLLKDNRLNKPCEGPVSLAVTFRWPWRKSEPKWLTAHFDEAPYPHKPDCDNIVKMLQDSMKLLRFFLDDAQVTDLRVIKRIGQDAGLRIVMMDDPPPKKESIHVLLGRAGQSPAR
jgi:Holliday junction resolvase RusA-like endonuclease|tara:strand:+ start:1513 stop:2019 length:507 start_codon:yes stop_codon:yes gene_type:complete